MISPSLIYRWVPALLSPTLFLVALHAISSHELIAQTAGDLWLMKGHDHRRSGQSRNVGPRSVDPDRSWERTLPAAHVLNIGASVDRIGLFFGSWGLQRRDSLGRDTRFWNKYDGRVYGLAIEDGASLWAGPVDLDLVPYCYEYAGRERTGADILCGLNSYHLNGHNGTVEGQAAIDTGRGVVYVGRGDGKLYAIDRTTGEIIWRFAAFNPDLPDDPDGGGEVVTSPLLGKHGVIYFGTWGEGAYETNAAYAVDPDGTLRWRWPADSNLPHRLFASPAQSVDRNTVYFATFLADSANAGIPGKLYAFETGPETPEGAAGGNLRWELDLAIDGDPVVTTTLAVGLDGTIYGGGTVMRDGGTIPVLYAVRDRGTDATLLWTQNYTEFHDGGQFVLGIGLREEAGVTERLYVTTANFGTPLANWKREGALYAVQPASGAVMAAYDPSNDVPSATGGLNSPAIDRDGVIYVGVRGHYRGPFVPERINGHYFAIEFDEEANAFRRVWSHEAAGYVEWNHPAIGPDGGIYVGSSVAGSGDSVHLEIHRHDAVPPNTTPTFHALKGPGATDVPADAGDRAVTLEEPRPNPVGEESRLRFHLHRSDRVRVVLLDLLGRETKVVFEGSREPGTHDVAIDANELEPGVYLCVLEAGGERAVRVVTVAR